MPADRSGSGRDRWALEACPRWPYGTKFASVLAAISATAVATAVLPEFSRLVAKQDWSHLRHTVRVHAGVIALVALPGAALMIWLSGLMVRTFFEGGAFDASATRVVTSVQQVCAASSALARSYSWWPGAWPWRFPQRP
jgi:peptidoglycan biosynthesis protein MviN/MurJ (putative lipid II flippase)